MVETLEEKILEDEHERSPPPQISHPPSLPHQIDDDEEVESEGIDTDMDMKINIIPPPDPSTPQRKEEDEEEEAEAEEEEEEGVDAKQSPFSFCRPPPPLASSRKPSGKKMKLYSVKKLSDFEAKLQSLMSNFDPQNFLPSNMDVARYERVLRLLGLWDFANLNFESVLRKDLLAQLIAYYDRDKRRSSVNDIRIQVSRADLARALGIPVKKLQSLELEEEDRKVLEDPSMKSGLMNFLMSWVVLVGDIGIIPDAAQSAAKMIENGEANKVDWAGLLWRMVEREITDAPKTGACFYASHLQQLIRNQKPGMMFVEKVLVPKEEVEAEATEVTDVTEVTEIVDGLEKEEDSENAQKVEEGEKQPVDVSFGLGLGGGDENAEEECRQQNWFLNPKNVDGENLLRPCSSTEVQNMEVDIDANIEQHEEENHVTHEDDFTSKFPESSVDLLRSVDVNNISFSPSLQQPLDPSSTGFLVASSPIEQSKDMHTNYFLTNSSVFGNLGKRTSSSLDNEDDDDDDDDNGDNVDGGMHSFDRVCNAKRARTDFDHVPRRSIPSITDEVNHFMAEIKMCSDHKDQEIMNCQMQLQYLNQLMQQKDEAIEMLERNILEEQHKRQMVLDQFEHERTVMSHMVLGYQKAIRSTRQEFAEYRKQFPQGVEPLYIDVPGSGGVVLTARAAREFERQRCEKLESEKQCLEKKVFENNRIAKMVVEFSRDWSVKFDAYEDRTIKLANRFKDLDEEFKVVRENIRQNKQSDKTLPQSNLDKDDNDKIGIEEQSPESEQPPVDGSALCK